jgi:hypothetical protein
MEGSTEDRVRLHFQIASDDRVGNLLSVLAGHTRLDGFILELDTGTGVGTAWMVSGLGARRDVTLVTIESDPIRASTSATAGVAWVRRTTSWRATIRFDSPMPKVVIGSDSTSPPQH